MPFNLMGLLERIKNSVFLSLMHANIFVLYNVLCLGCTCLFVSYTVG